MMPNFRNGVASFGIPLIGSGPAMSIRAARDNEIFFVDCINGSDSYNGKKPERAKLTIQAAVDACSHDKGSYIFIGEGQWEEQISITKRGIHLIGMGPYRTQLKPASSMAAVEMFSPVVTIRPTYRTGDLTAGQVRTMPVELCNLRVSGGGGYTGIYIGDGADGLADASATIIHNCLVDGSNREGKVGIAIRGGSFIQIVNNLIAGWATAGVVVASGVTRTAYYNKVDRNHIVGAGYGVTLCGVANSNMISDNLFADDSNVALTMAIAIATVLGIGACTGTANAALRNILACALGITLGASDFMSGNTEPANAGNSASYITEE